MHFPRNWFFSLSIPFSANFPWDFTHLSVSSITRNSFASSPEELTSSIHKLEIQSKSNVYCWLNRKGFAVQSNTSNIPKHRISLRILPKISVTISRHLLPHSMAKSQVSNMLSPCNARLKVYKLSPSSQRAFPSFPFRQSAANSVFHAACNFVANVKSIWGVWKRGHSATPISQHAPVYTFRAALMYFRFPTEALKLPNVTI